MRLLLAALSALALSIASPALVAPAAAAGATTDAPTRRVFTPADAAREMRAALKPRPAAKQAAKPRKVAAKPAPRAVIKRAARPVMRRAARPTWRVKRWPQASRWRRGARAPSAAALAVRMPVEVPNPVFMGDLYIQAEGAPMWSGPNGTQLARLPRATLVTNMGKHGAYYKVEAPNGAVGYVQAVQLGPMQPAW